MVLADIRDVERSGEGLVSTTFGAYPDRKVDWMRAGVVLGLLKLEWGRAKKTCPDMPAAPSAQLDQAIADLTTSMAAKDQAKSVRAANAVGLAVPDLFDWFHQDAPKEIVRMDAMFRQLGIDAHFGKLDLALKDYDSLQADYTTAKASIASRVPTCHRVAGTSTVQGDIESSLANAKGALATMDAATLERESENGALEIDTLELLFDCPPDGPTAGKGIGATCAKDTDCVGESLVCDPASTKCAPDPTTAKIGTACTSTVDCGTNSRSACNTAAGDMYPGGYCFMEPCNDVDVCPPGSTCVSLGGETPGCFKSCKVDDDCRVAEGYVCQLFSTTPPIGFGPSNLACAFKCTRDEDCQKPLTCDITAGKCKP